MGDTRFRSSRSFDLLRRNNCLQIFIVTDDLQAKQLNEAGIGFRCPSQQTDRMGSSIHLLNHRHLTLQIICRPSDDGGGKTGVRRPSGGDAWQRGAAGCGVATRLFVARRFSEPFRNRVAL